MRVPFIVYALNPTRHSYEQANQTLTTATPNGIRNTHLADFGYHIKCFDDTLYSQEPVTFVKDFNDDDVA